MAEWVRIALSVSEFGDEADPTRLCHDTSAFCITPSMVQSYQPVESSPRVGDVMYGRIASLGAKLILVCGSSVNAGKSTAAVALCWALTTMGHKVRASKITGTASLRRVAGGSFTPRLSQNRASQSPVTRLPQSDCSLIL